MLPISSVSDCKLSHQDQREYVSMWLWCWATCLSFHCWRYADPAKWKLDWGQSGELLGWGSSHWICTDCAMWSPLWSWTSICRFAMERTIYRVQTGWHLWTPPNCLAPSCSAWRPAPGFHSSLECRCFSTSSRWHCLFPPQTRWQHGQISWSAGNLEIYNLNSFISFLTLLYIRAWLRCLHSIKLVAIEIFADLLPFPSPPVAPRLVAVDVAGTPLTPPPACATCIKDFLVRSDIYYESVSQNSFKWAFLVILPLGHILLEAIPMVKWRKNQYLNWLSSD